MEFLAIVEKWAENRSIARAWPDTLRGHVRRLSEAVELSNSLLAGLGGPSYKSIQNEKLESPGCHIIIPHVLDDDVR